MFVDFKSALQQMLSAERAATEIATLNDLGGNITRRHF